MTGIQAIETTYAGCRFRSRAEARWAVFLDTLRIPWIYEHQGYNLADSGPYLPDFLVYPGAPHQFWLEIKGKYPTADEIARGQELSTAAGLTTYLYFAPVEIPAPNLSAITLDEFHGGEGWSWDDQWGWVASPFEQPATYELDLHPTAFRFDPQRPDKPERKASSNFIWWTECPHCGRVLLKFRGQPGWCPKFADEQYDEERDGPLYPRFCHNTPRLLNAYCAARSARFEHGEST